MPAPKNDQRIVYGVVIAVIAILIIAIVWTSRDAREFLPGSSDVDSETREVIDPAEANNFNLINKDAWDRYEHASEDIQVLDASQVMSTFIAQDPQDEDIYYFAAYHDVDSGTADTMVSIYRYTYSDYTFERIYKTTIAGGTFGGDEAQHRVLIAAGVEDGTLLLLSQPFKSDIDFGCHVALAGQTGDASDGIEMFGLDLEDPYAGGLTAYELPEEVRAELEAPCEGAEF